jgi:hypothetical protein
MQHYHPCLIFLKKWHLLDLKNVRSQNEGMIASSILTLSVVMRDRRERGAMISICGS